MYEGGPNRNTSCCLLPALENRRIAKQQFFTGSKISKPGCKAVNCFYRVALEISLLERNFCIFFLSFLGVLAVEMTVSFSKEQMRLEVRIEQFELNFVLFSSQSSESSISATATYVENYLDCE